MENSLKLFDFSQKINFKNELLAGFTVAMTMIPESLSFAILAGLSPLTGLYAAFMMGLVAIQVGWMDNSQFARTGRTGRAKTATSARARTRSKE